MNDALDRLIVDESQAINFDLLASLVKDYLRFTKNGEIIFEKKFYKIKDWQKVLIYLLGRKVIYAKNLKKDFKEEVSPKEIEEVLGVKANTIAKYGSRELKGIIKSEKGNYKVPSYNLFKCEDFLSEK